jgi:glyoxylase-like metal-dependent hydrolase (beta-lactamase superfamily II)
MAASAVMRVSSLSGNFIRLDAGTLFGHVPKALYHRWIAVDSEGRARLANRSLLVEDGTGRILLEAGVGTFFSPSLRRRYGVESSHHGLLRALANRDLSDEDIDWVILSHLHFDHAGGLLAPHDPDQAPRLLFPRARFLVTRDAWERSRRPHRRDQASFVNELPDLLEQSRRLVIVDDLATAERMLGERFRFRLSEGHTPGMLHTTVIGERASLFFGADLVPGCAWVHLPVTMGYDRHAELVVDEKARLYRDTDFSRTVLFYPHDPDVPASRIERNEEKFQSCDHIGEIDGWDIDRTERPT